MQFLWLALGLVACSEADKQEDTADVDSVEETEDSDDTGGGGDPEFWYPADQAGP